MRVLVYYAHPVETSFVAGLHETAVATLRARGHEVDDCDLNMEGFNPVLTREERMGYHSVGDNLAPVSDMWTGCSAQRRSCWSIRCGTSAFRRS